MPTLSGHGWPFIGTWSSSVAYSRGDVVVRSGVLYQTVSDVKGTDPLPVGPQWAVVTDVVMALTGSIDPTAGDGIPVAIGTTYQMAGSGLYVKSGSAADAWTSNPGVSAPDAVDVAFDPSGTDLVSTDVQAAGEELDARVTALEDAGGGGGIPQGGPLTEDLYLDAVGETGYALRTNPLAAGTPNAISATAGDSGTDGSAGGGLYLAAGGGGLGGAGGLATISAGNGDDGGSVGASIALGGGATMGVNGRVSIQSDASPGASGQALVSDGAGYNVWGSLGAIKLDTHATPADGDLAAGELRFWFDQTNGATKLRAKAKSANGTVTTFTLAQD